ncbi:MAG: hypothetical protein ACK5SJ_07405, partial [Bacteroidota bacterium]
MVNARLFFLFLLISCSLIAQDIPIDYVHGRPIISLPLTVVRYGDISIPIVVANSGDALRVRESEGSCGMGWNLVTGGQVTRQVRGLPDDVAITSIIDQADVRLGWLMNGNALSIQSFVSSSDDNLAVCSDEIGDWNFLNTRNYNQDTEPDLFRFSAPGISGQFVFDQTGTPQLLSDSDLKIVILGTPQSGTGIAGFEITTNRGLKYVFDIGERHFKKTELANGSIDESMIEDYDYHVYKKGLAYIKTWNLNTITSGSHNVSANFYYGIGNEMAVPSYTTTIGASTVDSVVYHVDSYSKANLTQVKLQTTVVDISRFDKLVSKVIVNDIAFNTSQEFEFNYQVMKSATDSYPSDFMAFLKEIKQSKNCVPSPSYHFTYRDVSFAGNTVNVSRDKGWGQDWFGYYNGSVNNKNIPTYYWYTTEAWPRMFRLTPIPNITPTQTYTGDMIVNPLVHGFGALSSINYPNGGTVSFAYEPHKYFDSSTNEELMGGGLRIQSITAAGGEAALGRSANQTNLFRVIKKEFEYLLAGGGTSGRIVSVPTLHKWQIRSQEDHAEETTVLYSRVKEKVTGQGSKVFEFSLPGMYPFVTDGDWQATKTKVARDPAFSCPPVQPYQVGFGAFPYAPGTNYDFARGLPARRLEYLEDGTLIREATTTYSKMQRNPLVIKGLRLHKAYLGYFFGVYPIMTGTGYAISKEVIKEASEETPTLMIQKTTDYFYNSNGLLNEVKETNPDNSVG